MTQKLRTAEAALEDEKTRFIQMESTWRRELNAAAGRERELKGALEIRQSDLDRAQTQVSKLTADKEDAKQHASDETAAASSHTSAADAGLVGIGVMMEPVKRNNRTIGWLVKDLTTKVRQTSVDKLLSDRDCWPWMAWMSGLAPQRP